MVTWNVAPDCRATSPVLSSRTRYSELSGSHRPGQKLSGPVTSPMVLPPPTVPPPAQVPWCLRSTMSEAPVSTVVVPVQASSSPSPSSSTPCTTCIFSAAPPLTVGLQRTVCPELLS